MEPKAVTVVFCLLNGNSFGQLNMNMIIWTLFLFCSLFCKIFVAGQSFDELNPFLSNPLPLKWITLEYHCFGWCHVLPCIGLLSLFNITDEDHRKALTSVDGQLQCPWCSQWGRGHEEPCLVSVHLAHSTRILFSFYNKWPDLNLSDDLAQYWMMECEIQFM